MKILMKAPFGDGRSESSTYPEDWEEIVECECYLPHHAPEGPGDIQLDEGHSDRGHQTSGAHASMRIDW